MPYIKTDALDPQSTADLPQARDHLLPRYMQDRATLMLFHVTMKEYSS